MAMLSSGGCPFEVSTYSRSTHQRRYVNVLYKGPRGTLSAKRGGVNGGNSSDRDPQREQQRRKPPSLAAVPKQQRVNGVQQSDTAQQADQSGKVVSGAPNQAPNEPRGPQPGKQPGLSSKQQQQRDRQSQQQQQQAGVKPRLSWRSSGAKAQPAAPADAAGDSKQQQTAQGTSPRLSWRSSPDGSTPGGAGTSTTADAPAGSTAARAVPRNASVQDLAPESEGDEDSDTAPLYVPAAPPPGYFRSQVEVAPDDEIDLFMMKRINTQHAAPASREQMAQGAGSDVSVACKLVMG